MPAVPRTPALRALALALPLAVAVPACAQAPAPRAESGSAAAASALPSVDSARLLRRLEVLAADSMEGRRVGTPGSARARRYLLAEMARIGLTPYGEGYERPFRFTQGGRTVTGVNLVGYIRGSERADRALVVTAHYDHEGVRSAAGGDSIFNGADDNASGVAAVLEAAEHFRANPPRSTILFVLLDAEEQGLEGAKAFLASPPVQPSSIVANVNLDMVSQSERGELYLAGASHYPFLRPLLEPVAGRTPVRLLFGHDRPVPSPADDWTMQSDHGAFHRAGIPFVYLGVEDHPYYHTPEDEAERVTRPFFVNATRTVIEVIRTLDAAADELARRREGGR